MAVIQDPQGAWFLVWQPNQHIGRRARQRARARCAGTSSARPTSTARPRSTASCSAGPRARWRAARCPTWSSANGDHSNGGIRPPMPPGTPPFWLVYFATDDIDATLAKVSELGGNVLVGNTDIGIARIAVGQDPQGAVFALYDGQPRRLSRSAPAGVLPTARRARPATVRHTRPVRRRRIMTVALTALAPRRRGLRGSVEATGITAPPPRRPPPLRRRYRRLHPQVVEPVAGAAARIEPPRRRRTAGVSVEPARAVVAAPAAVGDRHPPAAGPERDDAPPPTRRRSPPTAWRWPRSARPPPCRR